jgi:riboflavin kinase/FMN adenylyltransferase
VDADGFFRDLLAGALGASGVVVGRDFRFGARRAGSLALLERLAARAGGPRVVGVPPVVVAGERVSSSLLREHVRAGRVEEAAAGLGRPFTVEGRVVQGDGRGRQLGFPTANVEPREVMIPGPGVYACVLHRDDDLLPAVTNVGRRPTFGTSPMGVEAHVLDFQGNLYGARVRVAFLARLRAEQRFASAEELRAQVARDVEAARAVLTGRPPESLRGVPAC